MNVNSGETVLANSNPLFTISGNLQKMQIDTRVSEADIGKVRESQEAHFKVDAYPGQTFHGKVEQVRNEPITTNNVVTYNVVVLTDNNELKLKPGMTAEVKIVVADKKDVLRVPTAAIRFIPPPAADIKNEPDYLKNSSYVWIPIRDGQIQALPVETGASDGRYTEIAEGDIKETCLIQWGTEGERIIIAAKNNDRLQAVKLKH